MIDDELTVVVVSVVAVVLSLGMVAVGVAIGVATLRWMGVPL